MVEQVVVDFSLDVPAFAGATFRYGVLERLQACANARDVRVLAFGFGRRELRLLLEGDPRAITNTLRGTKVGTARAACRYPSRFRAGPSQRTPVTDLTEAVAWCHRAPMDAGALSPLASPWSSHRDLLGFRLARFFDASAIEERVDPHVVHALCGGRTLPLRLPPRGGRAEDLSLLLRIAAAVRGVLPADRRCFRLFVHLAKTRGWTTLPVARALALTTRRVRQLKAEREPHLRLALKSLGDPRLSLVP
jgi:hypothetical protein